MQVIPFLSSSDSRQRGWLESHCGERLPDAPKIAHYLRSGQCVAAVPRIERDHLCGSCLIEDSPHRMTDGEWLWIATTAYWVEKHGLQLPASFVARVRNLDYSPPADEHVASAIGNALRHDEDSFVPQSL